ncbi:hypothetical protein [Limosilactobacillus reuteri]|uniref:hypothetical protein n=1 Tax=Limosilactobacillus reuteri TaxID=1598 RepID=UPI0017828D79|nr:hypothetical protein [Limosilactobacillus reuteri]
MHRLEIMASNTLLLIPFWKQLSNINNNADIAWTIIMGICCLIILIGSVKDN